MSAADISRAVASHPAPPLVSKKAVASAVLTMVAITLVATTNDGSLAGALLALVLSALGFALAFNALAEILRAPDDEAPRGLVAAALTLPFAFITALATAVILLGPAVTI